MPTLENAVRNAKVDAAVDLVDAGSGAGKIKVYTSGFATLLVTFTFGDPAFETAGTTTAGEANANGLPITGTPVATGTAGAYEVTDSADVRRWSRTGSGAVSASGGGGEIQLTTTSVTSGTPIDLTACKYVQPAS